MADRYIIGFRNQVLAKGLTLYLRRAIDIKHMKKELVSLTNTVG